MQGRRNYSLDLLRVLAMFFVVVNHSMSWGLDYQCSCSSVQLNNILYPLFMTIAKTGVDCFVLISGFFLSRSARFTFVKTAGIWAQVLLYSVVLWLIFHFTTGTSITMLQAFTPFVSDEYWFVTQYLILLLLSPFLAMLCERMDKKAHEVLILLLTLMGCCIVSAVPFPLGRVLFGEARTMTFILLFFVAGYAARYPLPQWLTKNAFLLFFILIALQSSVGIWSNCSGYNGGVVHGGLSTSNNGVTMLTSLMLFVGFMKTDLNSSAAAKLASKISPFVFAVYLIHDNPNVRPWLWDHVEIGAHWNSPLFFVYVPAVSVAVFLVCISVDYVRALVSRLFRRKTNESGSRQ